MDDLVQFLRARLDEDEEDAKARRGVFPSPGVQEDGAVWLHVRPGGNAAIVWYQNPADGWDDMAKLRNWADTDRGWTQARVLAEVEAKRRLLDEHLPDASGGCTTCARPEDFDDDAEGNRTFARTAKPWPCPTVRLLALPYADHPAWRP